MADLVSYSIPNLFQGISQQPDAQRDPTQGEVQINGMSSASEGLRKREGSSCIARVSTTSFGDVFFHQILRDATEQYLAVISKTAIRVFDLTGVERTVTVASGAFSYLSSVVSAKADIRAASIADYTFISNTRAVPAMDTALAPAVARPAANEALVWVKAANYGQRYTVNVNSQQVTVTTAVAPVVVSGSLTIENRISTGDIAAQIRAALLYGGATALTFTGSATTLSTTKTGLATTTDGDGVGLLVNVTGNGTAITATAINAGGAGYQAGAKVFVARYLLEGGTDTSPVQVATVSTAAAGPLTGVTIARSGSVLHLTSSSAITIAATDARANADITAITNSVQAFTELPTIAPSGYQIEVLGDPGNKFDGYYVSFVCRSGTFGEGSWQETVSPGVEYRINQGTMPHLLVRLPTGAFWFGPANGTTVSGVTIPAWGQRTAGDYDTAPDPSFIGQPIQDVFIYKNRLGILADENIILSRARDFFEFFPETVTSILDSDPIDLAASNNRVSVLRYAVPYQDELIIFSDQIQFRFNAAETVLTPSTAQITVLTSYEMDPNCRPIPVQGTIVFCMANGQWSQFREFSVRGAGTALVADASDLTMAVSSYITSGVFKLASNDAGNVWFAVSGVDGYQKRIYVYKYLYRNTGGGVERAQSSWSHWELNGADEILSILCVEEVLYVLVRYGTEVWLEKLPVTDRMTDTTPAPYPLLLDRMVSTTTATPASIRVASGAYDSVTGLTTWTLPYTAKAPTQAWSDFFAAPNSGVLLGEVSSGNTLTARGDWSALPVFFGEKYNFRYRFTRFKMMRDIGGGKTAANALRTQIRHAKLRYHETSFFKVLVTAENRESLAYVFDGTLIRSRNSLIGSEIAATVFGLEATGYLLAEDTGLLVLENYVQPVVEVVRYDDGVFRIPILSRGENAIVEIQNDTAHPCKFSSCEWVGLMTGQARSLQ